MPGTVLTVASGKGGVGKTTTAVNLAVALWTDGNTVAVVDADLGMANLAAVLGLEPETTLHDVLSGRADLDEALIEAKDGDLQVLPGESELAGFADADPAALHGVLEELATRCDYVVVDTGAGLSYEDVLPLGLADEVLLVTTPDPAAIGDTRKTLELSGLLDGRVRGVVVTRVTEDTDAEDVASRIGVELLGTVPEDPAVTKSSIAGEPLASNAPDAPATAAYGELAAAVGGGAAPDADADGPESADGADAREPESADDAGEPDEPVPETAEGGDDGEEADESEGSTEDGPDATEAAAGDADEEPDGDVAEAGDGNGDASTADDGEGAADAETADADHAAADDSSAATTGSDDDGEEQRRGGLSGWLGRLFS